MRATVLRGVTWRAMGLIVCETAGILGAVGLAAYIRLGRLELSWAGDLLPKGLLIAFVAQLCLYFADLYDFRVITDRRELFIRAVQALGATSLILAGTYYWLPDLIVGRGVFILAAAFGHRAGVRLAHCIRVGGATDGPSRAAAARGDERVRRAAGEGTVRRGGISV